MAKTDRVTVVAEMPEEMLEQWRLFVVMHGGKVLAPVDHDEVEHYRRKIQHYEKVLSEQAEQRQSCVEQLEKEISQCYIGDYYEDYDEFEAGRINAFREAIMIVKGGGRDD